MNIEVEVDLLVAIKTLMHQQQVFMEVELVVQDMEQAQQGVNTGGGGGAGGAYSSGAVGGSGILIIRYLGTYNVADGSIFYETDTNKSYVLSSSVWSEL
jgi:hypothetical protein